LIPNRQINVAESFIVLVLLLMLYCSPTDISLVFCNSYTEEKTSLNMLVILKNAHLTLYEFGK
jgi:hypothetical protein